MPRPDAVRVWLDLFGLFGEFVDAALEEDAAVGAFGSGGVLYSKRAWVGDGRELDVFVDRARR